VGFRVVRQSEATVRQVDSAKRVRNFITKEVSPNVSLSVIESDNYTESEKTEYTRIYYVLEGELTLTFDETVVLVVGDSCVVEAGTSYQMAGTFKAVVINQPAFGS
jgi:mannose-6-phosphate isomerase-like protein (cupin superfamily)